jgi:Phage integrase family.
MTGVTNPLRSLPDGYSHYGDRDVELVTAVGKDAKVDQSRDRRLAPGEQELMEAALSGIRRPDRERPLELPEGDFMRLLFLFIVFTGARLQEAYMVLWENVDLHKKLIKLRTSKQRRGKVVYRLVPIRQELYPLLKAIKKPKGLVFPFWKGTEEDVKRCSGRLSHRFTDAYSYAGLEDITEHDLRHEATCRWFELKDSKGSWLLRSEEIHRLMGWSAGSTMAAKYASFRGEDLAARLWAAPA